MDAQRLPSLPSAGAVLKQWRSSSGSSSSSTAASYYEPAHSLQSAQDGDSTASLLGSTMLHMSRVEADHRAAPHYPSAGPRTGSEVTERNGEQGREREQARAALTLTAVQQELQACQQLCASLREEASRCREEARAACTARDAAHAQAVLAEGRLSQLQDSIDRLTEEHARSATRVTAAASHESTALAELAHARERLSSVEAELQAWQAEGARACTMVGWHSARLLGRPEPARHGASPRPGELHALLADLVSAVAHVEERGAVHARQAQQELQELRSAAWAEIKRLRALLQAALGTDERSYAVQSLERSLSAWDGPYPSSSSPSSSSALRLLSHGPDPDPTTATGALSTQQQQLPRALLDYSGLAPAAEAGAAGSGAAAAQAESEELTALRRHAIACEVRICELRAALGRRERRESLGGQTSPGPGPGLGPAVEAGAGMPASVRLALSAGREEACLHAGQVALWLACVRSAERESILAELQCAQGGEGGEGYYVDALVAAQARAASAERHCGLLRSSLSACEAAWSKEQARLAALQRGAVEAEAIWRDKGRVSEEAVRQAQGEVARLQELLASAQSQHQSDLHAVSADMHALEDSLARLQGEVLSAHAKVKDLEAQLLEERRAAEAELQASVERTRSSVQARMQTLMEERVGAAVQAAREQGSAVAKEDKTLALAAQEHRMREEHSKEMKGALEAAAARAAEALAAAVSSARAQAEADLRAHVQAQVREREAALEQRAAEQAAAAEERLHQIMLLCEEQARAVREEAETSASSAYADCDLRLAEGRREVEAALAHAQAEVAAERAAAERYRTLAKSELLRRRRVQSKLMDVQGHVRVMVRVRPTQAQIGRLVRGDEGAGAGAASRAVQDMPAELLLGEGAEEGGGGGQQAASTLRLLQEGQLTLALPHGGTSYYEYDDCHGPYAGQEALFDAVRPMLEHALSTGGNACVLAYGQTGSGKTYTMEGGAGGGGRAGIVPRALQLLFFRAKAREQALATSVALPSYTPAGPPMTFTLSVLEVYRDRVRDLLAAPRVDSRQGERGQQGEAAHGESFQGGMGVDHLRAWARGTERIGAVGGPGRAWSSALRAPGGQGGQGGEGPSGGAVLDPDNLLLRETEGGAVEVVGASLYAVRDEEEALHAIRAASSARHTGSHYLNQHSSRSHMIVRVQVTVRHEEEGGGRVSTSTLQFVDLAGSERLGRRHSVGEMARDAASINSSLSCLGGVLTARRKQAPHVPYRDSKLTFALKDCLTGKARVLLLACVSGEQRDAAETSSTLTFAAACRATPLGLPSSSSSPGRGGGGSPRPGAAQQPIYDDHPFYADASRSPSAPVAPQAAPLSLMSPPAAAGRGQAAVHGGRAGRGRAGSVG